MSCVRTLSRLPQAPRFLEFVCRQAEVSKALRVVEIDKLLQPEGDAENDVGVFGFGLEASAAARRELHL